MSGAAKEKWGRVEKDNKTLWRGPQRGTEPVINSQVGRTMQQKISVADRRGCTFVTVSLPQNLAKDHGIENCKRSKQKKGEKLDDFKGR